MGQKLERVMLGRLKQVPSLVLYAVVWFLQQGQVLKYGLHM